MRDAVWGVQPVLGLLRRGAPVERVLVARGRHGRRLQEIVEQARERRVPVRFEARRVLDRLCPGQTHQGVVALAAAARYSSREAVLAQLPAAPFLVVLDGIEDPRNLGAVLRTAAATGVDAVFLPERRAAGLTAAVHKAAAGTLGVVPVVRERRLGALLEALRERGVRCLAVEAGAPPAWEREDLGGPTALVLGGEGRGIRPLLRRRCEGSVGLPLARGVESLNISVAFGAVAYEVVRQRLRVTLGVDRGTGV